jgi:hypothetical protein
VFEGCSRLERKKRGKAISAGVDPHAAGFRLQASGGALCPTAAFFVLHTTSTAQNFICVQIITITYPPRLVRPEADSSSLPYPRLLVPHRIDCSHWNLQLRRIHQGPVSHAIKAPAQ